MRHLRNCLHLLTSSRLTVNAPSGVAARDDQIHDAHGNQQCQETVMPETADQHQSPCRPPTEASSSGRYRAPTCCANARTLPEISHRTGTIENPAVLLRLKFSSACRGTPRPPAMLILAVQPFISLQDCCSGMLHQVCWPPIPGGSLRYPTSRRIAVCVRQPGGFLNPANRQQWRQTDCCVRQAAWRILKPRDQAAAEASAAAASGPRDRHTWGRYFASVMATCAAETTSTSRLRISSSRRVMRPLS